MGVSYANHYAANPYPANPYPADVAGPGPVAPWFQASPGTGAGAGTQQPHYDGPGASRVSPVTPDLLRSLLRSLSQLR
ncbi:hypothetical protein EDD99_6296 [Streptomyces sp. 846.5]|nr:hypothetical protein [Streptomyces sp. 846.5]TDT98083.1 hypothetical protein EDD99_6296 [Streptomyces sp. 846.5]